MEVNDLEKFNAKSMSTVTGSGLWPWAAAHLWVDTLYDIFIEEFSRYTATGVKFSTALLVINARDIIPTSTKFAVKFGPTYVDPADEIKVIGKIKTRWVQQFMVCGVTLEENYKYSDELGLH